MTNRKKETKYLNRIRQLAKYYTSCESEKLLLISTLKEYVTQDLEKHTIDIEVYKQSISLIESYV